MQEKLQGFISYKSENRVFAEALYQELADWGFLPWLDVKKLALGYQIDETYGDWVRQIHEALKNSRFLIAVITPKSLESKIVQAEWFTAYDENIPIFPLRLEPFNKSDMPFLYRSLQYIDCVDNPEQGLQTLKERLAEFRVGRQTLSDELSTKRIGSLNTEILADLEELARLSPSHSRETSGKKDKLIGSVVPTVADAIELRDRVRRYWLEGILRPSLEESLALNINLTVQEDAVIEHEGLGNFELKGSMDVHKAYKELKNFLILGEAGAGKTVMLLQLATKLLRHEKLNMPLVLNLSSWGNHAIALEDWLIKEAETTYQIRAATFKRWLEDKRLILLLDGLDEIKEDVRAERIQRINAFRQSNPRIPIVLCSRIAEYRLTTEDKAEKKLDFPHALRLEALSREQVEAYLAVSEFSVVKALYEKDKIVQDLAQIPFLLTTMAYTYQDEGLNQLEMNENNNHFSRTKHLFERYISLKLKTNKPLEYSEDQVKEYLTWIAVKTSAYGTVFRPEEITIDWFRDDDELMKSYERLPFGKKFAVQYFISQKLPTPLDKFIAQMLERQIMRPMGGGHLFRHDYLRQSLLGESKIVENQIRILLRDLQVDELLETLKRFGTPIAPLIAAGLKDENEGIRHKVMEALFKIGTVEALIPLLNVEDTRFSHDAAWILGKLGDVRAVQSLIAVLNVEDDWVRSRVAEALGNLGDTRAVEPLINALNDENGWVRQNAAEALGKIGDIRAIEPLVAALTDENEDVRHKVRKAINEFGEVKVEAFIAALKDTDILVRRYITEELGNLGDTRAVEPLIATLEDEDVLVRSHAAEALGKLGDTRALEPLIATLKDENKWVLQAAAEALGKIGDVRAIEPLIIALNDEDVLVRQSAAEALGKIGDARAVVPLIAALKDEEKWVRQNAAQALREIGDTRALEPLIAALNDTNSMVRLYAAEALGKLGDNRALEPFIAALKDKYWEVRQYVAEALGKLGDTRSVEPLVVALKDNYPDVRQSAAFALRKIGTPEASQALKDAGFSEDDFD